MESVRRHIESQVLSLTGLAVGGVDFESPKGDPGLFGPDAACWKVHGDFSSMMIGGIGALLLQMLHPLALAGCGTTPLPRRPARAPASYRSVHLGHHLRPAGRCRATDRAGPAHPRKRHRPVARRHALLRQRPGPADLGACRRGQQLSQVLPALSQSRPAGQRAGPLLLGNRPGRRTPRRPCGAARPRADRRLPGGHASATAARTNAPAKWCGFSSTRRRPAPWPGRSAR